MAPSQSDHYNRVIEDIMHVTRTQRHASLKSGWGKPAETLDKELFF